MKKFIQFIFCLPTFLMYSQQVDIKSLLKQAEAGLVIAQGSFGAELHKDLDIAPIAAVFRKGMTPEVDSYSAFFDNNKLNNTGLHGYLQDKGIKELVFCGLAGDFCVAYSANDAKALGYEVKILENCVKYINN